LAHNSHSPVRRTGSVVTISTRGKRAGSNPEYSWGSSHLSNGFGRGYCSRCNRRDGRQAEHHFLHAVLLSFANGQCKAFQEVAIF
jgi:hypothetical protein